MNMQFRFRMQIVVDLYLKKISSLTEEYLLRHVQWLEIRESLCKVS